jgi:hypothetical protein
MKEPEIPDALPVVAPDFFTLRVEVTRDDGREVWRSFRQWRSFELPELVLFEEVEPSATVAKA